MRIVTLIFVISMGLLLYKFGFAEKKKSGSQPEVSNAESKIEPTESPVQTDIPTVTIGNQVWMTKNLNVSTFRNGDLIPQAKTQGEWVAFGNMGVAAWCYYENIIDEDNKYIGETFSATIPNYNTRTIYYDKYGKLYNWYAVNDPRGLAPLEFHVPSDDEWTELIYFLGGFNIAGLKMKSSTGWNNYGNGTNSSRFSAFPGGFRDKNGVCNLFGFNGGWWSSSDFNNSYVWGLNIFYNSGKVYRENFYKGNGFSVRCLRD